MAEERLPDATRVGVGVTRSSRVHHDEEVNPGPDPGGLDQWLQRGTRLGRSQRGDHAWSVGEGLRDRDDAIHRLASRCVPGLEHRRGDRGHDEQHH